MKKAQYLSVNRDMAGMLVTYTGYTLLLLFIILALDKQEFGIFIN